MRVTNVYAKQVKESGGCSYNRRDFALMAADLLDEREKNAQLARELDEAKETARLHLAQRNTFRAEAEKLRKDAERRLVTAFVQGAKWWEYEKENATMWQSDQIKAFESAQKRVEENTLGWTLEEIAAQRQKGKA